MKKLLIFSLLILSGCTSSVIYDDVYGDSICSDESCEQIDGLSSDAMTLIQNQKNDTCSVYASSNFNQRLVVFKKDGYTIDSVNSKEVEGLTKVYVKEDGSSNNLIYYLGYDYQDEYVLMDGDNIIECQNNGVNLDLGYND